MRDVKLQLEELTHPPTTLATILFERFSVSPPGALIKTAAPGVEYDACLLSFPTAATDIVNRLFWNPSKLTSVPSVYSLPAAKTTNSTITGLENEKERMQCMA